MSLINIINISVLDNPSPFTNPIQFEVTFECLGVLDDDLEVGFVLFYFIFYFIFYFLCFTF